MIFAFPGAGGHYRGMGADLYRDEPVFRSVVDEVAELLVPHIGADVRDIFDRTDTSDRIRDVAFAVPALFAISLGTARLLQSWGLTPAATLGHSLGECTAAAFTGALTLADACTLVAARCTAAARSAGVGGMMSVALSENALRDILVGHPELDVAAVNGPNSCVVAGIHAELQSLERTLEDRGVDFSMLRLDAAMHSRHVEAALGDVEQAVRSFAAPLDSARIGSVYSTVTGGLVDDAALREPPHWVGQLRSPVQFSRALTTAVGSTGNDVVIIEVGPGSALTGLALAHGFANAAAIVPTMNRDESESVTVRAAVGRAWAVGVDVDLAAVSGGAVRRRVRAPGYRFDRRHLWIEPADADTVPSDRVDDPLQIALWRQLPPADATASLQGTWAVVGTCSAAEALRREFASCDADVDDGEAEGALHGVVYYGDEHDSPAAAVTSFAETAAHLVPRMADNALWLLVTRNGSRVTDSSPVDPVAAALRTLPRILGQEAPGLRWAAVDV
ncbi:MAG: acyltransferase domain-containing protein, partial [Rhodococcus sp. (in: high G+C Gram-positive bacteria)]